MARKIEVQIVGDSRSLERAFKRSSDSARRFSVGFGTIAKAAIGFGAVTAGIQGLSSAVRAGAAEFSDAAKAAAQTNAVLESTGGVANVTADRVDALATSIQNLSGIDDETIKRGENLILTFKNIRNELGKGNQIFDRATQAAVDLSVAGFGSIDTTAKQLGKALNDPVRGMTALGRAGVTFTDAQKKQIKALVESNDLLGAQRVILREVESQVGGSAKALGQTLPGQLNRLKESFKNTLGGLVGNVAPTLTKVLGSFNDFVADIGKARTVHAKFQVIVDGVKNIGRDIFNTAKNAVDNIDWPQVLSTVGTELRNAVNGLFQVLGRINFGEVGRTIGDGLSAALSGVAAFLRDVDFQKVGEKIVSGIADFLKSVNWKAVAVSVIKLLVFALRGAARLLVGIGKELGKQLIDGIGAGIDAAKNFVLRKLLEFVNKVLGVTGFLGRFDPFKGVREKVQKQLDGMVADSRNAAGKINDALAGIKNRTVTLSVDVTTGRREEGATGRAGLSTAEKITGSLAATIDAFRKAAQEAAQKGSAAIDAAKKSSGQVKAKAAAAAKAAKAAADAQKQAFGNLLDSLSVKFDAAESAGNLRKALAVLDQEQKAVQSQIKIEGQTAALERQLLDIRTARARIRQQLAANAKAATQSTQFKALGLDAEGNATVPTIANLRKQLASLTQRVATSDLGTPKLKSQLDRIRKVLSGTFGKATVETRDKIKELFDTIRQELGRGVDKVSKGPLTKTTSLNLSAVTAGLGLPADQLKALQSRLSRFNSAGVGLASPRGQVGAFGGIAVAGAPPVPVVNVYVDGESVESRVTVRQQKRAGRTSASARGRFPGRV